MIPKNGRILNYHITTKHFCGSEFLSNIYHQVRLKEFKNKHLEVEIVSVKLACIQMNNSVYRIREHLLYMQNRP